MKPMGRTPRSSATAKQRVIVVRVSGEMHARLCDERERRQVSINQQIVDALRQTLPEQPLSPNG